MKINRLDLLDKFKEKGGKKNVLIVSDAFYPLVGGATIVVDSLAKSLAKFCNVAVVTSNGKGACDFDSKAEYLIIRCKGVLISKNIGCLGFPNMDSRFKKLINSLNIDIIHIHSYFSLAKFFIKFAKKNNIPILIHGHSKFYEEFLHSSHSKLIAKKLTKNAMKIVNSADLVLPVSNGKLERYKSLGLLANALVMPNATNLTFLKDKSFVQKINEKYKLNNSCIKLCFLSRITKVKNIDILVEMADLLKKQNFKFELYIIGFGEDEQYLKNKAKSLKVNDVVKFLGKVTEVKEKSALIQNMDLLVFPSVVDNCCLVKYEFASQKVPTLCVKDSATSEDIFDNQTGYTAEESSEKFAEKVIEIFGDKKSYTKVKQEAFDTLGKSWDMVSQKLNDIYDELIKSKE